MKKPQTTTIKRIALHIGNAHILFESFHAFVENGAPLWQIQERFLCFQRTKQRLIEHIDRHFAHIRADGKGIQSRIASKQKRNRRKKRTAIHNEGLHRRFAVDQCHTGFDAILVFRLRLDKGGQIGLRCIALFATQDASCQ